MAVYGGLPVVFWTGELWTATEVDGSFERVEQRSPAVFGAETRFWFVR